MKSMGTIGWVAFLLVVVGAINWGLVGLFGFNLVTTIFGFMPILEKIVYILIGVSGVYMAYNVFTCGSCSSGE